MLPSKGDIVIAFKMINLMPELSANDKRVACAYIDHFNRRTGQCDPSYGRIARLLQLSRRTIIRCMNKLVALGLFSKVRHGGNFHRNSYRPNWARFRSIEANWQTRSQRRSAKPEATSVSPGCCQSCHSGGGTAVTQTCSTKPFLETSPVARPEQLAPALYDPKGSKELGKVSKTAEPHSSVAERFHVKPDEAQKAVLSLRMPSFAQALKSGDAARAAANRGWNHELQQLIRKDIALAVAVAEAFQPEWHDDITEAEFRKPGSGIGLVVRTLRANGIVIELPSQSEAGESDGA